MRRHRRRQDFRIRRAELDNIREARSNRREDYELGPLAPRRDIGEKVDTYGAFNPQAVQQQDLHWQDRVKWWKLRVGDRVVMLRGRDKGKIGQLKVVDEKKNTVEVDGLNQVGLATVHNPFRDHSDSLHTD